MPGVTRMSCLEALSRTCREVVERDSLVEVDKSALDDFAKGLSSEQVKAAAVPVAFPIRFPNIEVEVTSIAIWNVFKFGSGYETALQKKYGRSAREVMEFGALSMMLSARPIDIHLMKSFSMVEVQNFFRLEASEDQELTPGITVSRPGALSPLCEMIKDAMNSTGQILESLGHKTLGAFILSTLDDMKAARKVPTAGALVGELEECFPAFQDTALYRDQKISFNRKAQLLVSDLYGTLQDRDDRFTFPDIDDVNADSGNVIPAYLRTHGILKYADELEGVVDSQSELELCEKERVVRAAGVAVCNEIAGQSRGGFSAWELGCYIMHVCMQPGGSDGVQAHLTKGTMAY